MILFAAGRSEVLKRFSGLAQSLLALHPTGTDEKIIRRRLFEWDLGAVSTDGKIILPKEAIATCNEYAHWVVEHRQQLPSWFPLDKGLPTEKISNS